MAEYLFTCALIAMVMISANRWMGAAAANKLNTVSSNIAKGQ